MLRHAKSPSKYTSLARLREIADNCYRGRDGQDYEASEVDALLAAKADALSDDAIEAWTDYCEELAAHEAELEAEYFADMDSTLLESTPAETGDGSISAAACAPWTTLVIEYTAALVRRAWGFFSKGSKMLSTRYRRYDIEACTNGGYQIYFNGRSCGLDVTRVPSLRAAKAIIDSWVSQDEYEGYCDGEAAWMLE
jgi:hypothetical protein